MVLLQARVDQLEQAVDFKVIAPPANFIAQLRQFRRRQGFGARRLVDELRRAIEVLGVEGCQDLRRPEFRAQARNFLIERRQTPVSRVDASRRFQELQCDVELALVERRLHPGDQYLRQPLQSLPRFAVVGFDDQDFPV